MSIPTVGSVMTRFPYAADASTGVVEAGALMDEQGIRHLPVVDGGEIVGIISDRDLLLVEGRPFHRRRRRAVGATGRSAPLLCPDGVDRIAEQPQPVVAVAARPGPARSSSISSTTSTCSVISWAR